MQSHPLHRMRFWQYRPHQLRWGDREMGTACYLMHRMQSSGWPYSKVSRHSSKAYLFVQLFFMQLFLIQRSYILTISIDHHVLLVHKQLHVHVHKEVLEVPEVLMDK